METALELLSARAAKAPAKKPARTTKAKKTTTTKKPPAKKKAPAKKAKTSDGE
jgi:DNA topoisomerase-1